MMSAANDKSQSVWRITPFSWGLLLVMGLGITALFQEGVSLMVKWWEKDEYSHGFLIAPIVAFLIWQKKDQLERIQFRGSWAGVILLLFGLSLFFVGELNAPYIVIQYGYLIAIVGLVLAFMGWEAFKLIWVPLLILAFMVPLPNIIYRNLSAALQLISSEIGVAFIRLFDISVYLEGNIIDLGNYKLQVVEACSGLRYLFPLMTLGFIAAYFFNGALWKRAVIFLSSIPITVLMNSLRIGVIGVMVEYWGQSMAEGFLHDFEGWVIFMACLAVLCVEIALLNYFGRSGRHWLDLLDLKVPSITEVGGALPANLPDSRSPLIACLCLAVLAIPAQASLVDREESVPSRESFTVFPLLHRDWYGRENAIDDQIVDALHMSDYITVDYRRGIDAVPVNLYVAYYESQRKGSSIHSPRSCIPGGGWVIADHDVVSVSDVPGAPDMTVNQLVIENAGNKLLVHYWFDQRGRVINNEYLAKWFLFYDSLTLQRTDGALVRLMTEVPMGQDMLQAESRLNTFMRDFYPILQKHVPR